MLSKSKVEAIKAVVALLCTRFPHCFMILPTSRRPLAIGIHHKLVEALDGTVSVDHLKRALALYCGNIDYIRAGARPGAMRVDLDGNPAGPVTESERANYIKQIEVREARLAAKKAEQAAARVTKGVNVNKDTVVTATTTTPTMSAPLQPLKPLAGLAALKAAGSARRKALESA